MENTFIKTIERELLIKAVEGELDFINTHRGMSNDLDFSKGEIELLNELTKRLYDVRATLVIGNKAFAPFFSDYNGSNSLIGIRITTVIS
jgi:hypothetical protein